MAVSIPVTDSLYGLDPAYLGPVARPFPHPLHRLDPTLADMQVWPLRSYLQLRAVPASVPAARSHARKVVREWCLEVLADTVELIVSEMTTNAVRASAGITRPPDETGQVPDAPQMRLWLTSDWHNVLVQVWDGDHRHPTRQCPSPDDESGRGMLLIESLSAQSGCSAQDGQDGKITWAVCTQEAGATA